MLSHAGEKCILEALSSRKPFFLDALPKEIRQECEILKERPLPNIEDLAKIMPSLLRICTQAEEEVQKQEFAERDASFAEHEKVQELIGEEFDKLMNLTERRMNEKQLRLAAAMTRRVWTPLGSLPDSMAFSRN